MVFPSGWVGLVGGGGGGGGKVLTRPIQEGTGMILADIFYYVKL